MSNNYDFTTYSEEFDALSEEERVKFILNFCCDNTINEQQADNIVAHTNKLSDYTFLHSFFRIMPSRLFADKQSRNLSLLLSRIRKRIGPLVAAYNASK